MAYQIRHIHNSQFLISYQKKCKKVSIETLPKLLFYFSFLNSLKAKKLRPSSNQSHNYKTNLPILPLTLTFLFAVLGFLQEVCLFGGQHEGQRGQSQGVEDEDDGEDEGPTHLALPHLVLVRLLPTGQPHPFVVPAVRVDDTAKRHTNTYNVKKDSQT